MKSDALIIGGGLAGLTCGIRLQKKGMKCTIISTGQSALHFSSGSFDLLNELPDGTKVDTPVSAIGRIGGDHPYAKLGNKFTYYAREAKQQLLDCGINVNGDAKHNHFRITPMGTLKPTWLTSSELASKISAEDMAGKKVLVVNIAGFLDFNTKFVADSFEKSGAGCQIIAVNLPELERLRISPTEMRSTNIARVLENGKILETLISELDKKAAGFDIIALPAVFGLSSVAPVKKLKDELNIPVWLIPTMPPSVPGIRMQQQLRRSFEESGGIYMLGDTITKADFKGNKVQAVYSVNHGDISFVAENFVLASGSYFSNGLIARPDSVVEPVFGSDVDFTPERNGWYDRSFFNKQNYMTFGVATDEKLRIKINGCAQQNLFATGAVLSGFNPIHEGCGAGVSMLTALYVADNLINGEVMNMQWNNISENNFEQCIKCTVCTAYCPVIPINPEFPGPKQAGPDEERLRLKRGEYYDEALKHCLNCKRCEVACPSNVKIGDIIQLARIKYSKKKPALRDIMLANTDFVGTMASAFAPIVNITLALKPVKMMMDGVLKIDRHRVFPKYSFQTFESWYKKNARASQENYEKQVSFFHGCYINYNFPRLGKDVVSVLNAIGYGVCLLEKEQCCGVALISNGLINQARRHAESNLRSVRKAVLEDKRPVIGASSTCIFTMRDEYPHLLGIDNSDVRDNIELATRFIYRLLEGGKVKLKFRDDAKIKIAYHTPCHMEKLGWACYSIALLRNIPNIDLVVLDSQCCGIAGTYGFKKENYETSQGVGVSLFRQIEEVAADFVVTDCETCKWQIEMSTPAKVKHPISILAEALDLEGTMKLNKGK